MASFWCHFEVILVISKNNQVCLKVHVTILTFYQGFLWENQFSLGIELEHSIFTEKRVSIGSFTFPYRNMGEKIKLILVE